LRRSLNHHLLSFTCEISPRGVGAHASSTTPHFFITVHVQSHEVGGRVYMCAMNIGLCLCF